MGIEASEHHRLYAAHSIHEGQTSCVAIREKCSKVVVWQVMNTLIAILLERVKRQVIPPSFNHIDNHEMHTDLVEILKV